MSSHKHQTPRLPPELISTIVDYISNDKPTLKAFSLVSKAWLPQCQAYLWRSIRITHDIERTVQMMRFLNSSTILESYIESCTLDFERWANRLILGFWHPFPNLKQRLNFVKRLYIGNVYPAGPNVARLLGPSLHWNNVTVLAMDNVFFENADDIFRILWRVPLLRKLHLDCTVYSGETSSLMQEVPVPPLDTLSYNGIDSSLYQWLIKSKGPVQIAHLRLTNVSFLQRGLLQALFERLGDQLEHLLVRYRPEPTAYLNSLGTAAHPFNVSSNKSLRYLCLQDGRLVKSEDKPWNWIPRMLSTIESEQLEEIRWEVFSSHSSTLTRIPGAEIENILAHRRFSNLSKFTIRLNFVDLQLVCPEVQIIESLLPRLHKSGQLHIVDTEDVRFRSFSPPS